MVDVRWTKESHREVAGLWIERKQKCLHMELGQRGRGGGGVGTERELGSPSYEHAAERSREVVGMGALGEGWKERNQFLLSLVGLPSNSGI